MNIEEREAYYQENKDKFYEYAEKYALERNLNINEIVNKWHDSFVNNDPMNNEESINGVCISDILNEIRNKDYENAIFVIFDENMNEISRTIISGEKENVDIFGKNLPIINDLMMQAQFQKNSIYFCHNHPLRYAARPSDEDEELFGALCKLFTIRKIQIADIGIVTKWDYLSVKQC